MIRIGVIGDIGSGKTFIAKLFKKPIFNADEEVKLIYRNSRDCFNNLKKKIPKFIKSFPIRKNELVEAISNDKRNLIKISSVVHPFVRKKMKIFLKKNRKENMVILDVPLLIENKLNNKKDILIFIKSNQRNILKRLKKRTNFNEKVLKSLKKNQSSVLKKKKLSDYVVDNNYSPNIMKKKINKLKNKILNERSST